MVYLSEWNKRSNSECRNDLWEWFFSNVFSPCDIGVNLAGRMRLFNQRTLIFQRNCNQRNRYQCARNPSAKLTRLCSYTKCRPPASKKWQREMWWGETNPRTWNRAAFPNKSVEKKPSNAARRLYTNPSVPSVFYYSLDLNADCEVLRRSQIAWFPSGMWRCHTCLVAIPDAADPGSGERMHNRSQDNV